MTNGESIRSKNDKDLVAFLYNLGMSCYSCPAAGTCEGRVSCKENIESWIEGESKEKEANA